MKEQKLTAGIFIYSNGKALIVKRAETENFAPNYWELPGGHVEFGETIEEGLTREAQEETGLKVLVKDTFYQFTYVSRNGDSHYIEVIVFAELDGNNQEVHLNPEEHSEYKWISDPGELQALQIFHLEKEAVEKGFEYVGRVSATQQG